MLHSFTRGYYTPSFYRLVVNTIYNLADLDELEKERLPFSTFFHEYLHFLQDISTSFGLMNGMIILNEIKYFNNYAIHQKNEFIIPIPLNYNADVDIARQMRLVYMGYVNVQNLDKVKYVKKVKTNIEIPAPYNKKLEKVVVGFELEDGEIIDVDLGGIALIESMAHIAQTHFYPEVDHNSIPYKLAQLVVNHVYPEFAINELYIFALCDACLLTYHPGLSFYEFLQGIKNDKKIPNNEKDVYEMFFSTVTGDGNNLLRLFGEASDRAKHEFTHYFTTGLHNNEKDWIATILERAKKLRLKNPAFLLDLLKQGKANSTYFKQLIVELGSPLIQNIDSESHMFIPQGFENTPLRIDIFSSINEIFKVFDSGNCNCALINFCKNTESGNITDQRCENEPWTRVNDPQLCGFGVLWKMWGLADTKPLKK